MVVFLVIFSAFGLAFFCHVCFGPSFLAFFWHCFFIFLALFFVFFRFFLAFSYPARVAGPEADLESPKTSLCQHTNHFVCIFLYLFSSFFLHFLIVFLSGAGAWIWSRPGESEKQSKMLFYKHASHFSAFFACFFHFFWHFPDWASFLLLSFFFCMSQIGNLFFWASLRHFLIQNDKNVKNNNKNADANPK